MGGSAFGLKLRTIALDTFSHECGDLRDLRQTSLLAQFMAAMVFARILAVFHAIAPAASMRDESQPPIFATDDANQSLRHHASSFEAHDANQPFSVDVIESARRLRSFLKQVHVRSFGELYKPSSPVLSCAIQRYETQWVPLLHHISDGGLKHTLVVPPLDVAWVWHVDRLKPDRYNKYARTAGINHRVVDGAFTWQSSPNDNSGEALAAAETRAMWHEFHGNSVPFFSDQTASGHLPCEGNASEPAMLQVETRADVLAPACERQATFLWNVLQPNYEDDAFLRLAAGRYAKFLKLKGLNPRSPVVPTYPVDLMWHAHM